MHKNYPEEFYAYVTPYAENFHIMAYVLDSHANDGQAYLEEIGSKVYMSQTYWEHGKKSTSIVGVTRNNESIIMDLSNTPIATTVSCGY